MSPHPLRPVALSIATAFAARHTLAGVSPAEAVAHRHEYAVRVTVSGPAHDDGWVVDYRLVALALGHELAALTDADLDAVLAPRRPTLEGVALFLADRMAAPAWRWLRDRGCTLRVAVSHEFATAEVEA